MTLKTTYRCVETSDKNKIKMIIVTSLAVLFLLIMRFPKNIRFNEIDLPVISITSILGKKPKHFDGHVITKNEITDA